MGSSVPKQLLPYSGSTVLETAVSKFTSCGKIDDVIVVSPADGSLDVTYAKLLEGICSDAKDAKDTKDATYANDAKDAKDANDAKDTNGVNIVRGGAERADSVYAGLRAAAEFAASKGMSENEVMVLIHDAARPGVDIGIIEKCIDAMDICRAVTVCVPSVDSIRMISDTTLNSLKNEASYPIITSIGVPRDLVYNVQTPQAFALDDILHAHERAKADGFAGTDDASYAEHIGIEVGIVPGSRANAKITTTEDLSLSTRVGTGYDVHRFNPDKPLILCGTPVPGSPGLEGHSDADVAVHALMDAMLGAAGLGDIGMYFPDTDDKYKGADSMKLLAEVRDMLGNAVISNVDITIIAEAPKLTPYKEQMKENIAKTLGIPSNAVNVKATTEEGLGFTGRGEAIAAIATAAIEGSFTNEII